MSLGNTLGSLQTWMEKIFGPSLWKFVLVCVDNIIVFVKGITSIIFSPLHILCIRFFYFIIIIMPAFFNLLKLDMIINNLLASVPIDCTLEERASKLRELCRAVYHPELITLLCFKNKSVQDLTRLASVDGFSCRAEWTANSRIWRYAGLPPHQANAVYGSRDRRDHINRWISKEIDDGRVVMSVNFDTRRADQQASWEVFGPGDLMVSHTHSRQEEDPGVSRASRFDRVQLLGFRQVAILDALCSRRDRAASRAASHFLRLIDHALIPRDVSLQSRVQCERHSSTAVILLIAIERSIALTISTTS